MIKTLFMGRKSVAAKCLDWLSSHSQFDILGVVTDSHLSDSVTTATARRLGYNILSHDEAADLASSSPIDLGISVLYWRKLKGSLLLSSSKYGCINFHPALLPDYKGCGGYNLAILDQLPEWGSTCHYVNESIDTGEIIDIVKFPVSLDSETAQSLESKTLNFMETQFQRILSRIPSLLTGKFPTQPNQGGRYISRREMEELKQVLPGDDPEVKARAFYFPPYDGAWVNVNGTKMTIIPTAVLRSLALPGSSSLFSSSS